MRISDWSSDVCSSDLRRQVLDADAVGAGLVVAGLVGDDHARPPRHRVAQLRDPLRAFVDVQVAADALAGAVIVVEAVLTDPVARHGVALPAGSVLVKEGTRQGEVPLTLQRALPPHPRDLLPTMTIA